LTASAERDLDELHRYVADGDGPVKADRLIDEIASICANLSSFPLRGNAPKELRVLGMAEFREVHFQAYRVTDATVVVHASLDGRRNTQTLLRQRLLRVE